MGNSDGTVSPILEAAQATWSGSTADLSRRIGDYDVAEAATSQWKLDAVVCVGGDSTTIGNGKSISARVNWSLEVQHPRHLASAGGPGLFAGRCLCRMGHEGGPLVR